MTGTPADVEQHVETSPNGRYIRYNSVLGKGAYKTVYKAFDTEEALEVAWNKLHVDRLSEHDLEKVSNEVSLLRQVNHNNIIHFYDTWRGQDANGNQTINFITEQMMSGTLKEYLRKAKAIKLKVIRRWCSNILEAIAYLHSQDPPIMHRDLKCDNIFINGHVGEVKIGDLGLSGVKEREKADSVIGTPEFMAPELYEESYTEKVDIYAFGMCLLEIVSMEYPYSECNNMAQIFKKVFSGEKPHAFDTLIDGDVKEVIAACLQREARRPSATDLLKHPLFSEWEKDEGIKSNLSLVKGSAENAPGDTNATQSSRSMPIGTELIDWSDPLKRNVLVSMLEGEGAKDTPEVSVVAVKENGGFYIGLEIPIRDAIKRVEFTFDPFEDSSQHIAHEMVLEFDLGTEQLSVIQQEIDLQVKIAKEQREAASRNATPQPAKQADPASSSPSRSSQTDSKSTSQATSVLPSSGASHTEQSSIPAQKSLTHESISTTASEHISQHQVPEKIEHPPEVILQQPIPQPQVQEVLQNTVQEHAPEKQSISPELVVPQQVSQMTQQVPETQTTQHLSREHLVEQTVVSHAVEGQAPIAVQPHEPQQVQSFVREPIADPLSQADAVPSAQPLAPSFVEQVDARRVAMESQGSHAVPTPTHTPTHVQHVDPQITQHMEQQSVQHTGQPTEPQSVQHTEQHMETPLHPVPNTIHQAALPEDTLQGPGDGIGGTHSSSQFVDNKFYQQQLDVPAESTQLRASPSFGEGTTTQTGNGLVHSNDMAQQQVPMASVSESFAVSQTPVDAHTHDVHQEVVEARVEHHVHEQHQPALPHTSSFVSSQAQSSTSVETSSGVLSPILPQEAHMASTPFPQTTTTAVLESAIPPATQEVHSLPETQESGLVDEHVHTEETHISTNGVGSNANFVQNSRSVTIASHVEHGTYHGQDEVIHRVNSFPQQQSSSAISSDVHGGDRSIRHPSNAANHFPQSVSDEVLRAPSRVTVIDLPPRPPSTPITPASPGRDFSDEQLQSSPPTVRNMLQGAGVEPTSQSHSVAVQGENFVLSSQPRTREFVEERPNVNMNARSRPKSGSRPAIVVVSSEPSGDPRRAAERPSKLFPEYGVPEMLPSAYSGASDLANRRLGSQELPIAMAVSASQLADYVRSEPSSSQQPSPPATDQLRTSSWMSLQSDESGASTGFRDPSTSATSGRGLISGKYDQEWYTLNLKLMDFCARGIYEEVNAKLSQGASATFADYDKRTPLHLAATEGHVSICVLLIQHGAEVNAKDRWGQTPLSSAKEGRSAEVKELLVAHGGIDESARSVEVLSMELMQQAARGDLEAVRQKIVSGALVTFQDYDKRTPLHLACSEGHAEIAEVLLVNGALHSTRDRKGRSPVDDAVTNGHRSVLCVLKQYGAAVPQHLFETEPDLLHQKGMDLLEHAGRGTVEGVTECLSHGAGPNYSNYDNRTALHLACSEGRLEVVQVLLQAGAEIHTPDRWGSTPLDEARKAGFAAIVEEVNRWDVKRAQRQVPSVSFDHSVMMNGHVSKLQADKEAEGSHFDHLSHGIATSVSMGAIPHITVSADDFVAEYPSSSTRDPASAGNSTSFSLPLTPFEAIEDISRVGNQSSEEILLEQAYNARKRQLEEDHRRAVDELLRRKSAESLRPPQVSSVPLPPRTSSNAAPDTPVVQVTSQDTTRTVSTRAISDPTDYGTIANGNVTRMEQSHSGGTIRMPTSRATEALPSTRIAGATYMMKEDSAVVGSAMPGENPAIRNLVDGLIDAAVRSNS